MVLIGLPFAPQQLQRLQVTLDISVIPGPGSSPPVDRSRIELVRGGRVVDHFIDLELTRHLLAVESAQPPTWTLDGDEGPSPATASSGGTTKRSV